LVQARDAVTIEDLYKITLAVRNLANSNISVSIALLMSICFHVNRKACLACNFNCFNETEGLLKVQCNHVHCKSAITSQTVQDREDDVRPCTAYIHHAISHDLELSSRPFTYCKPSQKRFLYSCAVVERICPLVSYIAPRAVPLQ